MVSGGFMRDARTKGETPLHRAAAFGEEATVKMLLDAGAQREAREANGDTLHCPGQVGIFVRQAFFISSVSESTG
jgi:hypothetical protein